MLVRIFARIVLLTLAVSFGVAFTAEAAKADQSYNPHFRLPVDCTVGKDCWIINYPDATFGRAKPKGKDFRCGLRTYLMHRGTDFAVPDNRSMRLGVAVLAPKSGVVASVRDGHEDGVYLEDKAKIDPRLACGNGIRIKHAKNWESQLCHLRKGSIKVKRGDRVDVGDVLGYVGLSGKTEFPHVHFSARYKGKHVDPFTNSKLGMGCGERPNSLWHPDVDPGYQETVIYAAGFSDRLLKGPQIKDDVLQTKYLPTTKSTLIMWAAVFGVAHDMTVHLELKDPKGKVIVRHKKSPKLHKAWQYVGAGRHKPKRHDWPSGIYTLTATIERGGKVLSRRQSQIDLK